MRVLVACPVRAVLRGRPFPRMTSFRLERATEDRPYRTLQFLCYMRWTAHLRGRLQCWANAVPVTNASLNHAAILFDIHIPLRAEQHQVSIVAEVSIILSSCILSK
jgi:hypothetical protein